MYGLLNKNKNNSLSILYKEYNIQGSFFMFDYDELLKELEDLNPIVTEKFSIGKTVMGRDIWCAKIGRGKKHIVINGAHHGLEYITSAFLISFIKKFSDCLIKNEQMFGFDVLPYFNQVSLYIVPMVNPDGVDIAVNGLDITNPWHRRLISLVGIHSFQKVWQANANGVDLNHNYDADWKMTVDFPSPTKYGGEYAFDQPETQHMANLLRDVNCDLLLCFHSQGREIYYDFNGNQKDDSYELAQKMAQISGYTVQKPTGTASYGGCKDWFIKEFGRSGFTVEVGAGKNPLPVSELKNIFEENAKIILCAIDEIAAEK